MIQTLVATLMWALVASLLIFRRKRADRSITYAAITVAIAMILNVDAIYTAADPLLGGTNIATLIADALLMTGLFFLGRGVIRTGEYRPRPVRAVVSIPMLAVSLLAITVTFLFIGRGTTTTQFMSDLGDEPAAAAYSIINFVYGGIVIATMLTLAARQYRNSTGIQRLPAGLLTLGSAFGVALCVAVIVMDIAHVTGQLDLMHAVQPTYGPLSLLTFLFLCAGFAVQPAVRRAQHYLRDKRTTALAAALESLWNRATSLRPGLSQADPLATSADDAEGRLHREIVEIRDAMIDPRITFATNRAEIALLERTESHLLGTRPNRSRFAHRDRRGVRHDPPPRPWDRSRSSSCRRCRLDHRATTHRTCQSTKVRLHRPRRRVRPDRPRPNRPDHSRRFLQPLVRARRLGTALRGRARPWVGPRCEKDHGQSARPRAEGW